MRSCPMWHTILFASVFRSIIGADPPGCFAVLPLPHINETIQFIREAAALPIPPDGFGVTTAMGIAMLEHFL